MNNLKNNHDVSPLVDAAYFAAVTAAIRAEARRLLESGEISAVIGYTAGRRQGSAQPVIISEASRSEELVFSPGSVNNLALYLTKAKKEVKKSGKIAIVAKGCDLKALAGLMGESQLKREDLYIIGISCAGVHGSGAAPAEPLTKASIARKCRECNVHTPEGVDFTAGTLPQLAPLAALESEELARLEALTPAERWAFWKEQFSRCIRCMACRQVCPFCYCEQCLCDRNRPQGVETTPRPAGNMGWHIVRAMHLAGRCAGCAECERSCPMDIPLNLLNRKMANELQELYGHEAGLQPQEKGPLAQYKEDDDESFIK
jgi:ferredoxin